MRRLIVHPKADAEIIAAGQFLELRRGGAGQRFLELIGQVLERIEINPFVHAIVEDNVRVTSIPQFHYVLFYRILPDLVEVIAVQHGARNSRDWRNRL
jgi:plasmid stabilization system protein ParE